eukprot:m.54316 g.54316  ORF g.54316 m.54316 type:complete len:565 (-) comp13616_c0_seq1:110-1804(-)
MELDSSMEMPPTPTTPHSGSRSRLHLLLNNQSLSQSSHQQSPMKALFDGQQFDTGMRAFNADPPSSPADDMSTTADFEWGADLETPPRHRGASGSPLPPRSPLQPIANLLAPAGPESPCRPTPVEASSTPIRFCRRSSTIVLQKKPATPRTLLTAISRRGKAHVPLPTGMSAAVAAPANVNPFSSRSELGTGPKRSVVERSEAPYHPIAAKSGRFQVTHNVSRYAEEFVELEMLGMGEFGTVYKCKNKLDGLCYAIKKSKKKISGLKEEQTLLKEVYAHAVLQDQPFIVRYHSAWEEDDKMLIQNEYCDEGSLAAMLETARRQGRSLPEQTLITILEHVGKGVQSLHTQGLVHLDIKPGNIFIKLGYPPAGDSSFIVEEDMAGPATKQRLYKLGDLGMVTQVADPHVEEGDCRYLAPELLQDRHDHLMAADIFALGMTMYEAASGSRLPKNGEEWQQLRGGTVPYLERYSPLLNELLAAMLHAAPATRPDIAMVLGHPALQPVGPQDEEDVSTMREQLRAARVRNKMMSRILKSDPPSNNSSTNSSPDQRRQQFGRGRKASCTW